MQKSPLKKSKIFRALLILLNIAGWLLGITFACLEDCKYFSIAIFFGSLIFTIYLCQGANSSSPDKPKNDNELNRANKNQANAYIPTYSEDNPSVILAEGMLDRLVSIGLEKYLLYDFSPSIVFTNDDIYHYDSLVEVCKTFFSEILTHLELPSHVFLNINYCNSAPQNGNKTTRAGSFSSQGYLKTIDINVESYYSASNIKAIICHECTHYFMSYHKLDSTLEEINELRTDVLAILLGFGNILIDGYKQTSFYKRHGDTEKHITSVIGYISSSDCSNVYQFLVSKRVYLFKRKKLREEFLPLLNSVERLNEIFSSTITNYAGNDYELIQSYLYKYECFDYSNKLKQWKSICAKLSKDFDETLVEKAIKEMNDFCSTILSWISSLNCSI